MTQLYMQYTCAYTLDSFRFLEFYKTSQISITRMLFEHLGETTKVTLKQHEYKTLKVTNLPSPSAKNTASLYNIVIWAMCLVLNFVIHCQNFYFIWKNIIICMKGSDTRKGSRICNFKKKNYMHIPPTMVHIFNWTLNARIALVSLPLL